MEPIVLKDKSLVPTADVLRTVLKDSFPAYGRLETELREKEIVLEWGYYNDGKVWLGKLLNKKKNLGWLYIHDGYFSVSCFFMEKHREAISKACLPEKSKELFLLDRSEVKLKPINVAVHKIEQVVDVHTLVHFKKAFK